MLEYRREIDGLRAVAVIPVILYHAKFSSFSGGFVGVDVFFVISGYLITKILIGDLQAGRFSIARFYERRARRILPALFFVMLCCLPFAWALMTPSQLEDFARSLVSVSFFTSNILFWRETSYFGAAINLKPLLHTWSLAVEEQFYIFFPLLLAFLWRFARKHVLYVILGISVLSLMLAEWATAVSPSASFYLIPTRAWELGTGSICALLLVGKGPIKNSILSSIGLVLVLFSIFFFNESIPYPSLWTLVPVGGTALIIMFAERSTHTARLLSLSVFVWIGLISYSAYLWHQPLFAFYRLAAVSKPSANAMFTLCVLSLGLAALSWRFVEQPFRGQTKSFTLSRRAVFTLSATSAALFSAFGFIGIDTVGAPFRRTLSGQEWQELAIDRRLAPNSGLSSQCTEGHSFNGIVTNPKCRTGNDPRILLWGDSFAMHLAQALKTSALAKHDGFIQLALSRCAPIVDIGPHTLERKSRRCSEFNRHVLSYLKNNSHIKIVIMSSPYDFFYDPNGTLFSRSFMQGRKPFDEMVQTANYLISMGKRPVFVTPPPANGADLGQCLAAAEGRGLPLDVCDFAESDMEPARVAVFKLFDELKNRYTVIDLRDLLCTNGRCMVGTKGVFLFRDSGHLSIEGSRFIGGEKEPFSRLRQTYAPLAVK